MVTGRQVMGHLAAGEDSVEAFKRLDGPRIIPRIREPKPDLKHGGLVYDLSQAIPQCLGPCLWCRAHLIDLDTTDALEGTDPLRKKIDVAVQGDDGVDMKSGQSSVEDALLIGAQFAGHDMRWKERRRQRGPGCRGMKVADVPEVVVELVRDLMC